MTIEKLSLNICIRHAKSLTYRYALNHKGRNALERTCISKGYIVKRYKDVYKDCIKSQENKLGIFALDFNLVTRKGGFTLIR